MLLIIVNFNLQEVPSQNEKSLRSNLDILKEFERSSERNPDPRSRNLQLWSWKINSPKINASYISKFQSVASRNAKCTFQHESAKVRTLHFQKSRSRNICIQKFSLLILVNFNLQQVGTPNALFSTKVQKSVRSESVRWGQSMSTCSRNISREREIMKIFFFTEKRNLLF